MHTYILSQVPELVIPTMWIACSRQYLWIEYSGLVQVFRTFELQDAECYSDDDKKLVMSYVALVG